ncbi:YqeG family HAD IIIA-type phosphatase [Lachnospiraceae bacterium NSJ-143]|nr:YqeG family HAD IIIA-type phosphatase [Lachnospiraceae bacterium NSJ-143]
MLERFFPDLYVKSIFDIPTEELKKRGIKALVFDIDNTVAPFDVAEPDDRTAGLFKSFASEGFSLCLLSNNNKERVELFNRKLGAIAVFKAGKPGIKKLNEAMKNMGSDKSSTAVIGDQVFTDMYCAHRAGVLAIYTEPICSRDQLITKVKRGAERFVLNIYKRRKGNGGI